MRLQGDWLGTFRTYIVCVAALNLCWELAQMPLYTLWSSGSPRDIVFAAIHCTAGDVIIAAGALLAAILFFGRPDWPQSGFWMTAAWAIAGGLAYTTWSEWVNVFVRKTWSYSELMPIEPASGIGLSPLGQWLVVPLIAFWMTERRLRLRP